ncbi:MAG: hypothetical protein ABR968_11995 [Bacteroidales bacterium]|jgi:hypothetical protein
MNKITLFTILFFVLYLNSFAHLYDRTKCGWNRESVNNSRQSSLRQEPRDTVVGKGKIIMHWKNEDLEFWLFEEKFYKIVYKDGTFAQGTWNFDNGKLTLHKDKLHSTSEKEYQLQMMTKDEFDKKYGSMFDTINLNKNKDPYPLISK